MDFIVADCLQEVVDAFFATGRAHGRHFGAADDGLLCAAEGCFYRVMDGGGFGSDGFSGSPDGLCLGVCGFFGAG